MHARISIYTHPDGAEHSITAFPPVPGGDLHCFVSVGVDAHCSLYVSDVDSTQRLVDALMQAISIQREQLSEKARLAEENERRKEQGSGEVRT